MHLSLQRRRPVAVVAALAGLALLSGCSGLVASEPAGSEGSGSSGSDTASSSSGGSSARVDTLDADDVLVSETFALASNPDDTTTIGVQSLTVEGKTMILRLVVTPDFASKSNSDEISLYNAFDREFRPRLIDRDHLKEYSVIRGSGQLFAAPDSRKTPNGTPTQAWFAFAAPEDDIESIDLLVQPDWPEILDVPITR